MGDDASDPLVNVAHDRGGTVQLTVNCKLPLGHRHRQGFLVLEVLIDRT